MRGCISFNVCAERHLFRIHRVRRVLGVFRS